MKKQITLLVILFLIAGFGCKKDKGPDINKGLVSYFNFEDNIKDQKGYSNDGTPHNSPTYVQGKIGKSLLFNGTNQFVDFFSTKSGSTSQGTTIAFWMKVNVIPDNIKRTIVYIIDGDQKEIGVFIDSNNKLDLLVGDQAGGIEVNYTTGAWTHVVYTYQSGVNKLYMNGSLLGTDQQNTAFSANYTTLVLGYNPFDNKYCGGNIDELRIYNRALSAEEVSVLYNLK